MNGLRRHAQRLFAVAMAVGAFSLVSISKGSEKSPMKTYPTMGRIVREDPKLDSLVPSDAKIEVLAMGFAWSEGPIWTPIDGGSLLFSDIPNNRIMKWNEKKGLSVFMQPSGYTGVTDYGAEPGSNGLTLDHKGQLLACEHGDRRVSCLTKDGGKLTLADRFEGKRLNSPNDLVVNSKGEIYFTDPPYGLPNRYDDPLRELDHCGVYRIRTDGSLELLVKDLTRPNGLAFSPDEKILYVAVSDPDHAVWMAYDVESDGTLANGRVFRDVTDMVGKFPGLPDGMKVDAAGNIFATGPGGVHVMSPDGKLLGRIETDQKTANCNWGDDGSTLYMTADSMLCRIRTNTRGN